MLASVAWWARHFSAAKLPVRGGPLVSAFRKLLGVHRAICICMGERRAIVDGAIHRSSHPWKHSQCPDVRTTGVPSLTLWLSIMCLLLIQNMGGKRPRASRQKRERTSDPWAEWRSWEVKEQVGSRLRKKAMLMASQHRVQKCAKWNLMISYGCHNEVLIFALMLVLIK